MAKPELNPSRYGHSKGSDIIHIITLIFLVLVLGSYYYQGYLESQKRKKERERRIAEQKNTRIRRLQTRLSNLKYRLPKR